MLKTALVSLALALTGTLAAAGPVTFGAQNSDEGGFTGTFHFTLAGDQAFNGLIQTVSALKDDVTITSVVLSKGGTSYTFDSAADGTQLIWGGSSLSTYEIKGEEMEEWTSSYSLTPFLLSAGEWQLTINGFDADNKNVGSYSATLEGSAVPEPQSLALALGALGAMAVAARRKRASR